MDPRQFFYSIVKPNYEEVRSSPHDLRFVYNAIITMNTVAEYVALEQLNYENVDRMKLSQTANKIRDAHPSLRDLNDCAVTLKHVRKLGFHQTTSIISSTAFSPTDPSGWVIDFGAKQLNLFDVLYRAFSTLTSFAELA
jgi:hypothetical protein